MSYINEIMKRRSVRTYKKMEVSENLENLINDVLRDDTEFLTPFSNRSRFFLLRSHILKNDRKMRFGTYGFIKNPSAFIAGACNNNRESLVDFGYSFEKIILDLTKLGIGTCWLGGTFQRKDFIREITLNEGEMIPCVVSMGYEEKKRTAEKIMRTFAKSGRRSPWNALFFREDSEEIITESDMGIFKVPLEMLRAAPSASNKQPWRVVISSDEKRCHFFLQKTPGYLGNRLGFEMQNVDMGIALCHFKLTCIELGIDGDFVVNDNITNDETERDYMISFERSYENGYQNGDESTSV